MVLGKVSSAPNLRVVDASVHPARGRSRTTRSSRDVASLTALNWQVLCAITSRVEVGYSYSSVASPCLSLISLTISHYLGRFGSQEIVIGLDLNGGRMVAT